MTVSIFDLNTDKTNIGHLLWQAQTLLQKQIKQTLSRYSLSYMQFKIMRLLISVDSQQITTTQMFIATQINLDKMTVSKSLKNLETLDYITRIESDTDIRANKVSLTRKGKELTKQITPIIDTIEQKFFNALENFEQQRFITLLKKLLQEDDK